MDQFEHSRPESRARLWLSILAVVVITLVAILLVPEDEPDGVEAVPVPVQPAEVREMAEEVPSSGVGKKVAEIGSAVVPEPPATEHPPSPAVQGPEGSVARAFLAASPDLAPAEVTVKARELQQQGLAGDAWLLYFKAAREGNAEAALELGRQADPALFDTRNSALERPDPVQAHKWYSLAARAGNREAAERLDNLLDNLAKAADAGDERAALLLREWKEK